jgi:SsrA-binding protein
MPTLAVNKKARFDYEIIDNYEAGLVLLGHEVKSAKKGTINMKGSYVTITNGKATLLNMHIGKYQKAGSLPDYDPYRTRDLLLHKKEIEKLISIKQEKGLTLIPLKIFTSYGKVKLAFGVGRGKKKHDKRRDIKDRDVKRRIKRDYGV